MDAHTERECQMQRHVAGLWRYPVKTLTGELADQFLQCVANRDADDAGALLAEHVDWYVGGNPALAWTGRRTRRREVAEYLRTMWPRNVPPNARTDVRSR